MGKVGSTSVFFSIMRTLEERNGQKFHFFHNTMVAGTPMGYVVSDDGSKYTLLHSHNVSLMSFHKYIILLRVKLGLPFTIICPIREPIARDISAFFHLYYKHHLGAPAVTDWKAFEELFLKESRKESATPSFPILSSEHEFTLNWFDEHFKPLTGIDVYKQPFPIDRKWQIYRRGFTRILVYRVDLNRSEQTNLVSRFLGIKLVEFRSDNATKNLGWSKPYSRFRESVKLPEQYIRRMHDSRFAQHFWNQEELKVAVDKWRDTSSS